MACLLLGRRKVGPQQGSKAQLQTSRPTASDILSLLGPSSHILLKLIKHHH